MRYTQGKLGRVFVMRMDDGEDILEAVRTLLIKEQVGSALIQVLGALRSARMVTGPQKPVLPPTPQFQEIEGAWEVLALGTAYPSEDGPKIHLHGSLGWGSDVMTGCLRERASTYLIVEAVVIEILGLKARREMDSASGMFLLEIDRT
jgi:predicted DNA-binding protein with PD1-like motif